MNGSRIAVRLGAMGMLVMGGALMAMGCVVENAPEEGDDAFVDVPDEQASQAAGDVKFHRCNTREMPEWEIQAVETEVASFMAKIKAGEASAGSGASVSNRSIPKLMC